MGEKITGYTLLFIGVGIVLFSLINVYLVFTKKIEPVQLFSFDSISIDLSKIATQNLPENSVGELKTEILPAEVLNTSLNFIAQLLLMGFIATGGFKISHIGTLLLRPIKVNVKEKVI